jgi:hypothetical protein
VQKVQSHFNLNARDVSPPSGGQGGKKGQKGLPYKIFPTIPIVFENRREFHDKMKNLSFRLFFVYSFVPELIIQVVKNSVN